MKTRKEALQLLHEWVESESLRRHCLGVAACMEAYAKKNIADGKLSAESSDPPTLPQNSRQEIIDKWWICGLMHDFDWERFPSLEEHPRKGCEKLREEGYDEDIIDAIMGHNLSYGIERKTPMAKTLFAVDELSGLVFALAKVRPGDFDGMNAKSVRKAMKKKDFAAAINRDDVKLGMEEMGVAGEIEKENAHFELVIGALEGIKGELGFS